MPDVKKDPQAIREAIAADPNTAVIAEAIGYELGEYVEQVLEYVLNPKKELNLVVYSDEEMAERGITPVDPMVIANFLEEAAIMGGERSAFGAAQKPKVALEQVAGGQGVDASKSDPKLKDDIAAEMRRNRNKRG